MPWVPTWYIRVEQSIATRLFRLFPRHFRVLRAISPHVRRAPAPARDCSTHLAPRRPTMASKDKGKGKAKADDGELLTHQEIIDTYNKHVSHKEGLMRKISELQNDAHEHSLVLETLKKAEPTRRCFRKISGVLVERTVAEVLPAIEGNLEQLKGLVTRLSEELTGVDKKLQDMKVKYNIRTEQDQQREAQAAAAAAGQGVLV